jgi:hypothetical protein
MAKRRIITTIKLNITADTISARFWLTGSDNPSLPVLCFKIKKMIDGHREPVVKVHITAGLG